ncbi:MAG: flippase-like domain-containing protein [Chloroflexi bacterium]|nr:flippase-like domain-containing protein [Chloroflexota bacterium]
MASEKNSKPGRWWNWARMGLGLAGLGIVVYGVSEEDALLETFLSVDLGYIFIAFVLTLAATIVKTGRWWLVLNFSQVEISFQRLFGTYLVGTFFSQFMPGSSMGGDAMRMVETSVDTGHAVTSVSSVLIERAIGLATIIVSASIILLLSPEDELTGTSVWWVIHGLAIACVVGLLVLRMGWFVSPLVRFLERIKLSVIGSKIRTLSQAFQGQLGHWRLLVQMVALSFLANAATMTAAYVSLLSLNEVVPYFSFIPLIALAVAIEVIPISPGALGLREAAYVFFLTTFLGVSHAASLATALLVRGVSMALGVIGGMVFIARSLDSRSRQLAPSSSSVLNQQPETGNTP